MTDTEDRPPPAVGAYWIDEGDYAALLEIFTDGSRMPRAWAEWQKMAVEMEQGLKAYGHVVLRVRIDPRTFADWCAAHGASTGSDGRKKFVAAAVFEIRRSDLTPAPAQAALRRPIRTTLLSEGSSAAAAMVSGVAMASWLRPPFLAR